MLEVGPYRYSALASRRPADGELVLLLHGFPETSYEWRAQLERWATAGYRAVAPDQRGYAAGARPDRARRVPRRPPRRRRVRVRRRARRRPLPPRRATTGAASSPGTPARRGAADSPACARSPSCPPRTRCRSAPRCTAGDDQPSGRATCEWFRSPDAEAGWLADDAALLARGLRRAPADAAAEYLRVFTADGGAALTGGSTGTAPTTSDAPDGAITAPTLYVWSTDDVALGREAAEGTAAQVVGSVPLRGARRREPLDPRGGPRRPQRPAAGAPRHHLSARVEHPR